MKIITGSRIAELDKATAAAEGIASAELMERAAELVARWACIDMREDEEITVVAGRGNNGGDGLAAARILRNAGRKVSVAMPLGRDGLSPDCALNLERLPDEIPLYATVAEAVAGPDCVIFDALLGTGLYGALRPEAASVIREIDSLPNRKVSIDLPSGMPAEFGDSSAIVHADITLAIGFPKLATLLPGTGDYCGKIEIIPLEFDAGTIDRDDSPYFYITADDVRRMLLPRGKFGHKNDFGHALLAAGSQGMGGAAVLAAGGALRSGCGLVTVHLPESERTALTANWPSALTSADPAGFFSAVPKDLKIYTAVGAGPGLGRANATVLALEELLMYCRDNGIPAVLDADALNILADNPHLEEFIPPDSVLTPHPGELRRLVGEWSDELRKLELTASLARKLDSTVVVKGACTMTCIRGERFVFNSTGNPGMAKGGSGDVLTGLLAGLVARGYEPGTAAVLGVYLHGDAGDRAAAEFGEEAMNSADITDYLPDAFMGLAGEE